MILIHPTRQQLREAFKEIFDRIDKEHPYVPVTYTCPECGNENMVGCSVPKEKQFIVEMPCQRCVNWNTYTFDVTTGTGTIFEKGHYDNHND